MSYQVLARKWRPNRFGELVGQEHVVSAISNALDNNRLHHAYLFTGTRGVGKTTIARIFSKSLNCEQGLSAKPCGQCSTCQEIENGNFIDLLEIDAASRTKVEDTRELLDNVQYKPSRGRYKVYLIDEVHMLSKHSFNALLKTLEEPPPHVKFLLATTDPQKLPVTILSRCLQFNLKALSRSQISQQLDFVLGQENIQFDKESLSQLARAAQGSMRDALSLTDQAIAQGNGIVSLQIVTDMLGLMDKNQVLKLVHALVQKDSVLVMQQVETMANQAPDFGLVLAEVMSLLHQVALTQMVPDACKLETISARAIFQLAKSVSAEHIQLLYQIALTGKKDLPHAADARTGLEMTLLRMLAFSPNNLQLDAIDISEQMPTPVADVSSVNSVSSDATVNTVVQPENTKIVTEAEQTTQALLPPAPIEQATNHNVAVAPQVESSLIEPAPVNESEQALFAEQQDILTQAEDFGHQNFDYNELEPVTMGDSQQADFAEYAGHDQGIPTNEQDIQHSPQTEVQTKPSTSTADLIALRNKLKESQRIEGEGAEQVKKSDAAAPFDLAAIRAQNNVPAQTQPVVDVQKEPEQLQSSLDHLAALPTKPLPAPMPAQTNVSNSDGVEDSPPWAVGGGNENAFQTIEPDVRTDPETAEAFDPNAHLDSENVGAVTLTIPAFLSDKQKVVKALQVDDWSKLIEDMQVTALTKQLALHSAYAQQGNVIQLTLLESKEHLISDTAQQQLKEALCLALNQPVELEISLGQPINTPYALQLKVNQVRLQYAQEVIKNDPGIQLLQQQFSANVDEQSIQAR
jgi:DNA polymerase-3 subunit gamma/tau